jgi:hypothetical protein
MLGSTIKIKRHSSVSIYLDLLICVLIHLLYTWMEAEPAPVSLQGLEKIVMGYFVKG